jgi:hypothetical protein
MTKSTWGSRYAIAASTLALVFALGGTAYAVNTVRSSDIVNGTIKSLDIGTGAVRSIDIKNGAVTQADISAASLGRAPAVWARVDGDIATPAYLINRGGLGGIQDNGVGRYSIQVGRSVTTCTYQATARAQGVTAVMDEASTTAVNVYLDDGGAGNPVDADFDVVFYC